MQIYMNKLDIFIKTIHLTFSVYTFHVPQCVFICHILSLLRCRGAVATAAAAAAKKTQIDKFGYFIVIVIVLQA